MYVHTYTYVCVLCTYVCMSTVHTYVPIYLCVNQLPPKQMMGYLNVDIWTGVEGILVDDLRLDKRFPKSPSVSVTASGVTCCKYVCTCVPW